ncbi:MAG: C39 family peptidase [Anaerolineales bacterium]|nr:C39 family peptidase [Anaerolineales bacterium]
MFKKYKILWLTFIFIALAIGVYNIPAVNSRLAWRIDAIRTRVIYFFNPPEIFRPSAATDFNVQTAVVTARAEMLLTLTPQATAIPTLGATVTPTATFPPAPSAVSLPGVVYVDQHNRWNYCGPANLTMALNFWGWKGNRDDVAKVVKPGSGDMRVNFIDRNKADKNVMPYEMADFVNEETEYRALTRYGGDESLLKRLIAAGFPVIVEKGYYEHDTTGKITWLGHYLFTTGYDDARGGFIVQDAYLKPGKNLLSVYKTYLEGWRAFDYLFIVVYPADREAEVLETLGPWSDTEWANQHALDLANKEVTSIAGNDLFFAWFNKGTSHVALRQYVDAATAYDQAFLLYANWNTETKDRPYRMMWYQTGPYFAYYYAARYADVINLANTTLTDPAHKEEFTLEESLLWRGRAYYMAGQTQLAVNDFRAALKIHENWLPAIQALQDLGLQP